ncbi:glutaminase A [Pontibacter diazotrophicus]|uniref:Glutaminase n=1 Tax=Pontibacter diazotrophicus TaxID=1400979 RepID=A0A3D8LAP7_9BACT|nr:glutaminase A [Pontibacter diazotrophicus]RDV14501.1 glutaminase A [Pontibacter diazotrophicus]
MKDTSEENRNNSSTIAESAIDHEIKNELRPLFDSLGSKNGKVTMQQVLERLQEAGIQGDDVRLEKSLGKYLRKDGHKEPQELTFEEFTKLLADNSAGLIKKAILKKLSVPDFREFSKDVERFYKNTKGIKKGEAGSKDEEKLYAVSVCTIDGQKLQLGDHQETFALQSVCKAINYAIALHEQEEEEVHRHVGREPSGRGYNGLVLNQDGLPHNPMINAGAIVICSLIKPDLTVAKRLKHVMDIWSRICGNTPVGLNREMAETEVTKSERNMALSYYMKEQGAFPENTDIYKTMELYNKCCSIEVNIDQLAIAAATLANGGICPTTGDKVFNSDNVKDCLSLMLSCGMYDYSGEFAFLVGLPAKSGVSGAMMVVVPGLMGIAIYSPPLDELGSPVRGVAFCKELVKEYSFHKYDHVVDPAHKKKDPRLPRLQSRLEGMINLCWAASQGDLLEVQNLLAQGISAEAENFDKRTPLHLAAAEGHLDVVEYLLKKGIDPNPKDRWKRTPLADALHGNHTRVAALLRKQGGEE